MSEGDTPESHAQDTIVAGAGIVDEERALSMVREAPERVRDLLRYGVPFDRDLEGKLLVSREGAGFAPGTALHGWSMTKTVVAMLWWKKAKEAGLDPSTPVVQAFPSGRAPAWVAEWAKDERAKITVADLLFMRDGLNLTEGYGPTGDVVQMLYGEPDMSAWAAGHGLKAAPGTQWEYLSATSNILAAVTRAQFATDAEYQSFARAALFDLSDTEMDAVLERSRGAQESGLARRQRKRGISIVRETPDGSRNSIYRIEKINELTQAA